MISKSKLRRIQYEKSKERIRQEFGLKNKKSYEDYLIQAAKNGNKECKDFLDLNGFRKRRLRKRTRK